MTASLRGQGYHRRHGRSRRVSVRRRDALSAQERLHRVPARRRRLCRRGARRRRADGDGSARGRASRRTNRDRDRRGRGARNGCGSGARGPVSPRAGVARGPLRGSPPAGRARPSPVRVGGCARGGRRRAVPLGAEGVEGRRGLHEGVRGARPRTRAAGRARRHGRQPGRRRAVRGDPRMPYAVRSRMVDGARGPCQPRARARAPDRSARRSARGRGAGGGRVDQQGGAQSAAAARSPVPLA